MNKKYTIKKQNKNKKTKKQQNIHKLYDLNKLDFLKCIYGYENISIKPENNNINKIINSLLFNNIDSLNKNIGREKEISKIILKKYEYFYIYIKNYFDELCKIEVCDNKWISCKEKCFTFVKRLFKEEMNSTYYNLVLLGNSFLSIKNNKLSLIYNGSPLTGEWNEDYIHFCLDKDQFSDKGKLIMGFGPSASGKTYWANNIIELLNDQLNYPKDFISIDGGIQRESSIVYQIIKNLPSIYKSNGVKNLMSSGFKQVNSLFSSNKIKLIQKKYLKFQSTDNIYPNLYVPETLGSCATVLTKYGCSKKYKDYIKICNDNEWIGLYIWQSKTKCIESGRSREIKEGKKYSSKAYSISEKFGNKELFRNSGKIPYAKHRIRIHNSGGNYIIKNNKKIFLKSKIELDLNLYDKIKNKQQIEKKYNCIILKLNKNFNDKNPEFDL